MILYGVLGSSVMYSAGMSVSDNQLPLGNDAARRDAPVVDYVMSVMSMISVP